MRRTGFVALMLLAACVKEHVNTTAGTMVAFHSLGGNTSGYLSLPPGEGKKPAVVVIQIDVPIPGNFGADDRGIPVDDVRTFENAMKSAGKEVDIKIYDGAGHGFMNPGNRRGYEAAATTDAQSRIDRFFVAKLRANMPNS